MFHARESYAFFDFKITPFLGLSWLALWHMMGPGDDNGSGTLANGAGSACQIVNPPMVHHIAHLSVCGSGAVLAGLGDGRIAVCSTDPKLRNKFVFLTGHASGQAVNQM